MFKTNKFLILNHNIYMPRNIPSSNNKNWLGRNKVTMEISARKAVKTILDT